MTAAMAVHVRLPAALRRHAGDRSVLDVELPAGATVADLLDQLAGSHPDIERRVRDEQGQRRRHVNLFLGDVDVRTLDGLATPLPDGVELSILPAVSGG